MLDSFLSLCAASAAKALRRSVERKNFLEEDTDGDDAPLLPPEVAAATLRSALPPEMAKTFFSAILGSRKSRQYFVLLRGLGK